MLFDSSDNVFVNKYFSYQHLPEHLQEISKEFFKIATDMLGKLPGGYMRSSMLEHLLLAKDAAVRAVL